MFRPGPHNLITDVPGLLVGNAQDQEHRTGTTVLLCEQPATTGVDVRGGAPGTRETELLAPGMLVGAVDALFLSGGSAFGLDAGSGVANALARQGRGFAVGAVTVPIVSGAILFDLYESGPVQWGQNPYAGLGEAALAVAGTEFALGSVGCGTGAMTAGLKGGLGSASMVLENGVVVGALVGVNSSGSVIAGDHGAFWAGAYEIGEEFGGRGPVKHAVPFDETIRTKATMRAGENTTIAIVATNASLDGAGANRLAMAAHDGMARAIAPAHTLADGDIVFGVSTGAVALPNPVADAALIGHAAANCLARAIARGVHAATGAHGDRFPTWQARFDRA